jgi:hypothetical protein
VGYIIEQCVCLAQLYFKYESARKCQCKFPEEPVPSRQNIHYLVNNLKRTGSLLDKKPDRKQTVLTEETLDNIGARLETSPRKSLKQLVQETCFKNIWTKGHKIVKTVTIQETVIHALKEHDPAVRISFCN